MNTPDAETLWRRRASSVKRRINAAWWWDRVNALSLAAFFVLAVVVLCLRTFRSPDLDWRILAAAIAATWALVAVLAGIWSRRRFVAVEDGLTRLDESLHLRNRLSAAAAGVGSWPEYERPTFEQLGLQWRWTRTVLPLAVALSVVIAASLMPIPEGESTVAEVVGEPAAWEQMDEWLAALEEEAIVEEASLDQLEETIEELREQPEEAWFGHASLEATDTLKERLGRDIRELASVMETLERDLAALKNYSAELGEGTRQELLREFEKALEQLSNQGMEVNEALLKQLGGLDPSQLAEETLSGMSAEELESLRERLKRGSASLGSMEGLPPMAEDPSVERRDLAGGPGQGEIGRGRGDAPLFFGDGNDLGTEQLEQLEEVRNEDLSRAGLGELLGLGESEREVDESGAGPVSGGDVASTGRGGDAVWRDPALLPEEKALLKRYFK
ncbi:MAG: hypothetical protein WD342_16610 [Verrucomicrobiales bacterium]